MSRTEVLFNGVGAIVLSWTDREIKVRIPHRNVYGIGKAGEFNPDLSSGPLDGSSRILGSLAGRIVLHAEKMGDAGGRDVHDPILPGCLMRATGVTLALRILTTNNEASNIAHSGICSLFCCRTVLFGQG